MPTRWDAFYKQVLVEFLAKQQVAVTTEVEVGRLPRKIDISVLCSQKEAQKLALVSPFTFFTQHNLLEFKSSSDRLTPSEYKRIVARSFLYLDEVGLDDLSLLTVCAVTSGKPVKVLSQIPNLVQFSNVSQALYKSDDKLCFYVLVIPELAIEERNYPLLLFSKGKKRKAFLKELVRRRAMEYLRLAYELYPQDVLEVFDMSKDFPTLEENIQFIIKHLGVERILLGVERVLGAMQPEEIAQAVDAKQWTQIAQAIPTEQGESLLRVLIEKLGDEKVESILHNDGKQKS